MLFQTCKTSIPLWNTNEYIFYETCKISPLKVQVTFMNQTVQMHYKSNPKESSGMYVDWLLFLSK